METVLVDLFATSMEQMYHLLVYQLLDYVLGKLMEHRLVVLLD